MKKLILIVAVFAVLVGACAAESGAPSTPGGENEQTLPTAPAGGDDELGDPSIEPGDSAPPVGGEGQELPRPAAWVDALVEFATADLAGRLDITDELVTVTTSEPVTWRDGALGCPEPGMSYTQALVDGYRFELVVDGASYWYHQGGVSDPRFCVDPMDPVPSTDI